MGVWGTKPFDGDSQMDLVGLMVKTGPVGVSKVRDQLEAFWRRGAAAGMGPYAACKIVILGIFATALAKSEASQDDFDRLFDESPEELREWILLYGDQFSFRDALDAVMVAQGLRAVSRQYGWISSSDRKEFVQQLKTIRSHLGLILKWG